MCSRFVMIFCMVSSLLIHLQTAEAWQNRIQVQLQEIQVDLKQADQANYQQPVKFQEIPSEKERLIQTLQKNGIDTSESGLRAYLKSFASTEEGRKETSRLLVQLGSNLYDERETAMMRLTALPNLATELLHAAVASDDAEVAWRSKLLLERSQMIHEANYASVLQLISLMEFKDLAQESLFVLKQMNDPAKFKREFFAALAATASPADLEFLREQLRDPSPLVQEAALYAMRKLQVDNLKQDFLQISESPTANEFVRLQATYGLADLNDRNCLTSLLNLLSSTDVVVRVRANAALVALTQQDLQFVAYGDDKDRIEKTEQWGSWLKEHGDTVELHLPLEEFLRQHSYLNGNTLIAQGYSNRVVELDPADKVVWEYEVQAPWSAEKLASGNVLIAAYRDNKVIEVDMNKKVVWECEAVNVLNAKQLDNGNILMCLYSGSKVQEVNRDKKVVWEYQADTSLADAIRLPNGNTIIATNRGVTEIDPKGAQVWDYPASQAYGVSITPSGTLLISQLDGNVVELDRESKKVVWRYATASPVDAFRLANGNTLVTNASDTVEVDPEGKVLWKYAGANYGSARR
jgi:outer membrane protein assembly factor BamB